MKASFWGLFKTNLFNFLRTEFSNENIYQELYHYREKTIFGDRKQTLISKIRVVR